MLTDRDFNELLSYKAKSPVLSVYLDIDPARGNADAHRRRLRSMLKEVNLPEDVNAVLRYFDHQHDWSGRSVAVFSCAPEGFWKAISLAVPVRSRVRINETPHVKPLADILDSYGGYGVVLIDKQGARLFHFHLGELQEQEGIMGEAVRHTKRGGGSQAAGRRGGTAGQADEEEVAGRNMRDAVDFAIRFFAEKKVRRIVIGGTDDNVALFRTQLPKAWQSLIVGTFPVSMTASHTEVLERAIQIGMEAEKRREAHLAQTVVTNAAKGRGGVIHLEETLNAIRQGRVQTLLVRDGFRAPGTRCKSCGFISSLPMDAGCPFCGGEPEEIPDAVELAVRQVMQAGGEVEVLNREHSLPGFEQIGAILRY
jgi:peptide chain release factor subunit 1